MGQPHSLAASCPTGGGLATELQPSRNKQSDNKCYHTLISARGVRPASCRRPETLPAITVPAGRGTDQIAVKIQHKDRLLTDPGAIEDVLAVENDVVPSAAAFAGRSDTQQSPSGADLATLEDLRQVCFGQGRVELALRRKGHGQVSIKTHVLFYVIRPCNGLDTIVSNGRKKTMFRVIR